MLRLEIRHKTKGTLYFESEKSAVFLGRDRSMDIVLDDPLISRQHAVIVQKNGDYVLQDIGGRNPVRVNREPTMSRALRPGDVIEIGETVLVFSRSGLNGETSEEETSPTVVDAREGFERLRLADDWSPSGDETVTALMLKEAAASGSPPGEERRSRRNLKILRNFSDLIRSLSDRRKLLLAALDAVFDNLEVKRGFIGFFILGNQLEIHVERSQDPGGPAGQARLASYPSTTPPPQWPGQGPGASLEAEGRIEPGSRAGRKDLSYSRSIVERVRREGVAILFSDVEDSPSAAPILDSKSVIKLKIKSAMCFPLFKGDQVIGVLYIDNRGRSESFNEEDLHFATVLAHLISLAIEKEDLYEEIREENIELKSILHQKNRLVGVSGAAKDILRKIKKVAGFDTTVLIIGESGTGKELVARAIHDRSPRRANPFVAVNCAAIPETLLESELFGYAPKSGISGSDPRGKPGKFELAHGGTLFLDEIGDMSLSTQAKILRVLEEKVVDRLGGMEGIRVDLRIVAATNKVLEKAVSENAFREDLYYRLKVFRIDLPPLRERREDILPLAQHFLSLHQAEGRAPIEISPRARELLAAYHWPGNIRELKNSVEEAILLSSGRIIYPENLPSDLRRNDNPQPFGTLAEVESQHIARVLQSVQWNKRRAADILGINRSTLYEKIRAYGIEKPRERQGAVPVAPAVGNGNGGAAGAPALVVPAEERAESAEALDPDLGTP